MMAFGEDYVSLATRVANRTTQLRAKRGWCPLDPELDHVPVTLFTDLSPSALRREVSLAMMRTVSEPGDGVLRIRPISELPSWRGTAGSRGLQQHLGSWRMRWFHAQTILAAPYRMVTYLDVDALPCTAHGITRLMQKLLLNNAVFGAPMVAEPLKCQTSKGNCTFPHPEGLSPSQLREWESFTERNSGVVVLDSVEARPVAEEFAATLVRRVGTVSGDQFALREALFLHRSDVPQVSFTDEEVCRYRSPFQVHCETDASEGCAVHHMPRMGSLKIMH